MKALKSGWRALRSYGTRTGRVVRLSIVAAVGIAAMLVVSATAASAATNDLFQAGGNANFCMDANGGGGRGTQVILWQCQSGNNNQRWLLDGLEPSSIKSVSRGLCLDPGNAAGGWAGSSLILWDCNGANNQKWDMDCRSTWPCVFRNKQSGLVVDIPGFNYRNGTALKMWTSNGGANQKFTPRL